MHCYPLLINGDMYLFVFQNTVFAESTIANEQKTCLPVGLFPQTFSIEHIGIARGQQISFLNLKLLICSLRLYVAFHLMFLFPKTVQLRSGFHIVLAC